MDRESWNPDSTSRTAPIPAFPAIPTLLPEESRTVHAGFEQKLASDRVRVTADYFDSRFHNIVSFLNVAPSAACLAAGAPFGAGTYFNTDLARARGGNFSGEARITRWLSGSANYTYDSTRTLSAPTDPADLDPELSSGSRLLRRPVNSGNIMLNANYWRMNWNLSGYFTGKRYDYNFPGQIIDPGYALINLAATYNVARGFSLLRAHRQSRQQAISGGLRLSGARARVSHRREIYDAP